MIVELNENGLGFVSGRSISIGEEITLAWRFEPTEPPMQVLCVVRNTEETKVNGTNSRLTGAEFVSLAVEDRVRIVEFLKRRITSPPV
jgi:hypothetical protein